MTRTEAVQLVALVASISPAMRIEDTTADAWHLVLDDLRLADCVEAVKRIARRERWIAPADIRAEVRVVRDERIDRAAPYEPDSGLSLLEWRKRAADGDPLPTAEGLNQRDMRQIANVFRSVPGGAA